MDIYKCNLNIQIFIDLFEIIFNKIKHLVDFQSQAWKNKNLQLIIAQESISNMSH